MNDFFSQFRGIVDACRDIMSMEYTIGNITVSSWTIFIGMLIISVVSTLVWRYLE